MRFLSTTHKQNVTLSQEAYGKINAAANGIGKGIFVELALKLAKEMDFPPVEYHGRGANRSLSAYITTDYGEEPLILGAKVEAVLQRLRPPNLPTGIRREELIFPFQRSLVIDHAYESLKQGVFPHEALGLTIEQALRNLAYRMQNLDSHIERVTAPVDPQLYYRVSARVREVGFDFDSLLAAEVLSILRKI